MKNTPSIDSLALIDRLKKLSPDQRAQLLGKIGRPQSNLNASSTSSQLSKATPLRIESVDDVEMKIFPASHAQERMWFLHEYERHLPVYSSPTAFHLHGRLDVARLRRAFVDVILRHESLRTTFSFGDRELFQRVHSKSKFRLIEEKCMGLGNAENAPELHAKLDSLIKQPFDLAEGPLLRAHLLFLGEDDYILLVVTHHIIADGWSRANLFRELTERYVANGNSLPEPILPLEYQVADYSAWQDQRFEKEAFQSHVEYWREKLSELPGPLELPLDSVRPDSLSSEGEELVFSLDSETVEGLKRLAAEEGVTLFMALLAIYSLLLHIQSGQDEVVVGVPIANRPRKEAEPLIACLINSLAMRLRIDPDSTFKELLDHVKTVALEAYMHQEVPYERLLIELDIIRDPSRSPVFQTDFSLQDMPEISLALEGIRCEKVSVSTGTCKTELGLEIRPSKQGWTYKFNYNTGLFKKETIQGINTVWRELLDSVLVNPELRVVDIRTAFQREQESVDPGNERTESTRDRVDGSRVEVDEDTLNRIGEAVSTIWQELLGIQDIGLDRSLFDLGGHSLTATLISVKLRDKHDIKIPVREIFSAPTIRGITDYIAKSSRDAMSVLSDGDESAKRDQSDRMSCFLIGTGRMPIEIASVLRRKGVRICGISSSDEVVIDWASNAAIRHDSFWRKRFHRYQPLNFGSAFLSNAVDSEETMGMRSVEVTLPDFSESNAFDTKVTTFLVGAWGAFLARLLNEEVFDLGFQSDDRGAANAYEKKLLSACVPLRVDLDLEAPFSAHQNAVELEMASIEGHPVFGRDLVYRDPVLAKSDRLRKPGKFAAGFWVIDDSKATCEADGHQCILKYNKDYQVAEIVYDQSVISSYWAERLARWFSTFVTELLGNPELPIDGVPLLPENESRELRLKGHGEIHTYPVGMTIQQVIEETVARCPDRIAIEQGEVRLSYKEFNRLSNALAHQLTKKGVKPDTHVGVCIERSPAMLVAVLGILKAGGAYVPLDPSYPKDRIEYMIQDGSLAFVITSSVCVGKLDTIDLDKMVLDLDDLKSPESNYENPLVAQNPNHLAYMIYTSGSSGEPKGVQIEHYTLVNYIFSTIRLCEVTAADRILQLASLNFDASAEEIYCAFFTGATLVLRTDEMLSTPRQFVECLDAWKISFLPMPTAYWHSWVGAMKTETLPVPRDLRLINIGGEAARADAINLWQSLVGDKVRLFNGYGPTETTVGSTWFELTNYDCGRDCSVPIGFALDNLRAYVLDRRLNPVPEGVAGELCLGGSCLARGYHGRPALTAEKFVVDPFGDQMEERVYRTGDKVVYNDLGYLVFLGRIDEQVKIRGYRIELGEIETRLTEHPSIKQSVVIDLEMKNGDRKLAAYFVSNGNAISSRSLREYLANSLPDYMIPSFFMQLPEIPLTGSKKVDRKSLPQPELERNLSSMDEAVASSELEKSISVIWAEVLGVSEVGIHENFFELGGHSLLASQVISRVRNEFQVSLSLRSFFDAPSVAAMCREIELLSENEKIKVVSNQPLELKKEEQMYPVSFAQNRLWFLDRFKGGSPEYNISKTLILKGDVNRKAFEQAINWIIARHDALRTRFVESEGKAFQVVAREYHLEVPVVDLRGLPKVERESVLRKESGEAFDIEELPLINLKLFQIAKEEFVLLIKMHHIVSDGWSFGVFNKELSEAYNAFALGNEIERKPLELQYPQYSILQNERLQGDYLREQLEYWKSNLANLGTLELPTDRPRPSQSTFNGARYSFEFTEALGTQLAAFNKAERSTPFMSLMAAFQLTLARYSGQTDIAIGTPFANRGQVQEEAMIGFFVNTLIIRTDFSGGLNFKEVVRKVRNSSLDAFRYHEVPFEKLVEELNPERDPSRHPLFQVMFAMQNTNTDDPEFEGLEVSSLLLDGSKTHFDLSLSTMFVEGKWKVIISYNTDLFNASTIRSFGDHFTAILTSAIQYPETPVMEIPMLSPNESQVMLKEWGSRRDAYPDKQTIHGLFEHQARMNPGRVALVCDEIALTYKELDERANQMANYLQSEGVGPGALVGVCVGRSNELIIGMLAVQKAGGAYVPLDPHFPVNRLAIIMEDASIDFLISQSSFADLCSEYNGKVLLVDEWDGSLFPTTPCEDVDCAAAAYVIFTSGSTGRHKGIVIKHQSAVNMLSSMVISPGIAQDDVFLAIATVSFDISVFEIFGPLSVGARLVIMPDRMRADGYEVIRLFKTCGATMMHCTPSFWKILLYAGWEGGPSVKALTGGEALTPDLARDILPTCSELWNLYGPTETAVYSLATRVTDPDSITIGKPIMNTDVFIVSNAMQLVPVGVTGELLIGGVGLAKEYLNRPELTKERFIPNPFSENPDSRLYRTGDLCRWKPDGTIECLGRADNQVKIRGFRIELGEIESAIADYPMVREAAARVWDDGKGGHSIVAYVVPVDGEEALEREVIVGFLRDRLPDYMIPAGIEFLKVLPQTPNAKVDRNALPEPSSIMHRSSISRVAPETYWEKELLLLWSEILGVDDLGVTESFFDLGGHSLLAFQLVSRMKSEMGVDIQERRFFEIPTIRELAVFIEQSPSMNRLTNKAIKVEKVVEAEPDSTPSAKNARIEKIQEVVIKPVSYAQYRMWFIDQLESNSSAYNMPSVLRLQGDLDHEAIRRSIETLVERHEPYRTTFESKAGDSFQAIHPPRPFELPVVDLRELPDESREGELNKRILDERRMPFDLTKDLMIRAQLIRLHDRDSVLCITQHHIASDGWSHGIFWRELSALYAAYVAGKVSTLEDLSASYSEVTLAQQERLKGPYWTELLGFWKDELENTVNLELPTDRPRPERLSSRGASKNLSLGPELVKDLRDLAKSQQVTFFMVLVSSFQLLLSRLSGQKDVVVGMPSAGRLSTEQEKMIGLFINTVLLRTDFATDPSFGRLLSMVKDNYISALDYQEMPFERLVEELAPDRNLSRNPIFQVLVNMQEKENQSSLELPGLEVSFVRNNDVQTKFDLTLYIGASDDSASINVVYSTDLFDAERIEMMLDQYYHLLEQIVKDPKKRISSYTLVTDAVASSIPPVNLPMKRPDQVSVVDRFLEQVATHPDQSAVSVGDVSWSYREMGERVSELHAILQKAGVEPGDRVLIDGSKSFGTIVSMIGVLSVGGVIVPVDPELPGARKTEILLQTGARLLLSGVVPKESIWVNEAGQVIDCVIIEASTGQAEGADGNSVQPDTYFRPGPDSPAYIFFTSGTTGKPKGILGRYDGLNHFINWQGKQFEIGLQDRVAQLTSMSFDVSLRDIFLPLTRGATLCLPPLEVVPLSPDACVWLREEKITVLHTVPSVMNSWIQTGLNEKGLHHLRWTFSAGEPLLNSLVERWRLIAPQTQIVNLYGPTETTLAKCFYRVPDYPQAGVQPIGQPLPDCAVMIIDSQMNLAGVGELGEIVIRTPFTSLGYLDSADNETGVFFQNPYAKDIEDRWYRSGDLGRIRPDGAIDILGRVNDQIKIRGVRIEPRSIEKELEALPEVKAARVIGIKDSEGQNSLVAYVVSSSEPSQDTLYKGLALRLPISMIPSAFVLIDRIPLTLNGKLDRKALPDPKRVNLRSNNEFVEPRNDTEKLVASVFCELLELDRVSVDDNFFHLGGNSLLAVRLCYQVENRKGKPLRVASVFEGPTVAKMAELLARDESDQNYVTRLAGDGSGRPVFFTSGITRNALVFLDLAKHLEDRCTCYGIDLPPSVDGVEPFQTIEELAGHCVKEIAKIQPEGPYMIAGFSFGGLLAYETAKQLDEISGSESTVYIFDSYLRNDEVPSKKEKFLWILSLLKKHHFRYLKYMLKRVIWLPICFRFRWGIYAPEFLPAEKVFDYVTQLNSSDFHFKYEPKPVPLRLRVFTVRESEYTFNKGTQVNRWKGCSSKSVDYYSIDSDYHARVLIDPHLDGIVKVMNEDL